MSEVLATDPDTFNYHYSFEQIGIPSPVQYVVDYNNNALVFSTQEQFAPFIDNISIQEAWVDVKGYRMKDSSLAQLQDHFSHQPFTVCAQKVEVNQFPAGPERAGLRTSMNVRFNHVTDINILHPTDSRQRTVFRNIHHNNYQIQIGNQRFPEQLCSTVSPQFHEMQIQASDFDDIFEANDEYEWSLTTERVGKVVTVTTDEQSGEQTATESTGELRPLFDNTSFVPIFSLERSSNGRKLWFDGLDTPSTKIEINSIPLNPSYDVYYNGGNSPAPILCSCSDTYWIFRLRDGIPNCQYVTANTYADSFNDPSVESVRG